MSSIKIIWTRLATQDLFRLFDFLQENNPQAAFKAIETIREYIQRINHYPLIGRPFMYAEVEYRELIIGFGSSGYIAVYRIIADQVYIVALRHQKERQNAQKWIYPLA